MVRAQAPAHEQGVNLRAGEAVKVDEWVHGRQIRNRNLPQLQRRAREAIVLP
jgi:hypothetical protein